MNFNKQLKASKMAKIKQFEAFTKIVVAYKKNWVYINIMSHTHLNYHKEQ